MQYFLYRFPALIVGCFLAAMCLVGASKASAAGSERIQSSGESVSFSIPDVWPWAYEDEDGDLQGSLIDVAYRLSDLTGVAVTPKLRPLRRAIVELRSGQANFSILFQNPGLDIEAINVASVTRVNILLAAMTETAYPLTLEELKGKRVAYIRGTYLGEAFEQDMDVVKVPLNAISQAVELLSMGRISAVLASDHNIYRTLSAKNLNRDMLRYVEHVPGQKGTLYMSRVSSRPDVARKFKVAIEQMNAEGELDRIFYGRAQGSDQRREALSAQ